MNNVEQLRMFLETVEQGSFSACAKKLGKVQSAVSQGIANLEIDLDVQLFDRSTRKPSLTPEGERLKPYAEAILHQVNEFQAVVDSINKEEEALVRITFDNALLMPALTKILAEFDQKFPNTSLEVNTISSLQVANEVRLGRADIGIMLANPSFNKLVDLCFIGHLPFYAVCHAEYPLACMSKINVGDLTAHKQIALKEDRVETNQSTPLLSANLWWANDFLNIKAMVMQGLGWSYLPAHLVEQEIVAGKLCKLDLTFDHKIWSPPIDMVTEKNHSRGPAQEWLFESLKGLFD